ncbi:MAG: restriction endonuclease subunit S [Actinomycetota bacterium]|nr:restriction endonuclease subunit S [Actinomycetota bacterium]
MRFPVAPLKHLAALPISNGVGEAAEFDDPGWPRYVRTTDIAGPRSLWDDTFRSLPPEVAKRASLKSGDLLMTAAGGVGKSTLYVSDNPACYAGYLVRFRPRNEVDGRFVAYWAESQHFWDQIEVGKVVSTIDNFSAGKYQNLRCPSPSLPAQRAIADYLDTETARIDALITKKQRMIELLENRRLAAIETALGGGRTAVSFILGDEQSAQEPVPLKRLLIRTIAGGTPDSNDSSFWTDEAEGTAWVAIGDMLDSSTTTETVRRLTPAGLAAVRLRPAPAGTLLFAMYASLGKLTVSGMPCVWNQAILGLVPDDTKVDSEYLALWLEVLRQHFGVLARSTTQDNLNAEQVGALPIPNRPLEDQLRVVRQLRPSLTSISSSTSLLVSQVDLLRERRQALITAAVTGELEIPGVAA